MKVFASLILLTFLIAGSAPGYYHFIYFGSRTGPFVGVPQRFDVSSLPGKTLTWFVGDTANVQLAPGDSTAALLSEIRSAVSVWNSVETSDLRIAFGGNATPGLMSVSPSVDVVFDEVPGLVAMGGPTKWDSANATTILKSVVWINPDLTRRPSYSDSLFTTFVHEFGHALGLQHTFTSGVMATSDTRSTSKGRPLSTDDIAAISILYPKGNFTQSLGAVSGRVTMNGQGVNLASVVAISPNGAAVSTLTNPDGTYTIEGLPPRNYYVYVHPLPPALDGQSSPGDIFYPLDSEKRPFVPGQPFETVFFSTNGGVKDPANAAIIQVNAGSPVGGVNISVRQRTGYGIHTVKTYAFPGSFAARPPYVSPGLTNPFIVATGFNMFTSSGVVGGLRATTLGGADLSVRPYAQDPVNYVQLDFDPRTLSVPSNSPRHVVFSANNDIYVLPSAFFHVERLPPVVTEIAAKDEGSLRLATVTGTSLHPDSRILFDGFASTLRLFEDLGGGSARVTIALPSAPAGHRSVVSALNSDGQSSLSVQANLPPAFTYTTDPVTPAIGAFAQVTPSTLGPGTEGLIQIDTLNTQFVDGQVTLAFGTADIVVRSVWVVSPTRIMANIVVSPRAQPALLNLTIINGLQSTNYGPAFGITSLNARAFWISGGVVSLAGGIPVLPAGSTAVLYIGATPASILPGSATVLINEVRVPILTVNGSQVSFQIPPNTPPGFASVRVEVGSERSTSVGITVDPAPIRPLGISAFPAEGGN
ncbi:MAG: matrixin family metalloprotease [Bryobacteraceae bacterium]|nr:matrixin family metalloprotease [Bryobacteraceae bacterium]